MASTLASANETLLRIAVLGLNAMKRRGDWTPREMLEAARAIDRLHEAVVRAGGHVCYAYIMDEGTGIGYLHVLSTASS